MNSLLLVQWVGFRMLFLKKQVQGLNGNLFDSGDLRKLRDFIAIYRILFQKISKNDTYFDWKSAAHDVVPSAKTKENEKLISCSKFSRKIKVFSKIIEMQQVFRYYQTTKKNPRKIPSRKPDISIQRFTSSRKNPLKIFIAKPNRKRKGTFIPFLILIELLNWIIN